MAHGWCHGSSPGSPCLSKALPQSLTSQPVSEPFRMTSDPVGWLVYFLFSFTNCHMFPFLFLYLMLLISPVYISVSDLQSWLQLCIPNFKLCPWLAIWLLTQWNSSAWSLRITTVSVHHTYLAHPCLRVSLYTSGLISVLPWQKIKLYIDDPTPVRVCSHLHTHFQTKQPICRPPTSWYAIGQYTDWPVNRPLADTLPASHIPPSAPVLFSSWTLVCSLSISRYLSTCHSCPSSIYISIPGPQSWFWLCIPAFWTPILTRYIVADTVGTPQVNLWGLSLCQVRSQLLFPCICYRTEDYHCLRVSHLFGSTLS